MSAVTLEASGTQTATIGTEHTLGGAAITTAKVFTLVVDCAAMVNGDITELRIYSTVLTAGTERLLYGPITIRDAMIPPILISPPVPSDISVKFTLKQTAGTGRAFPWKVLS
jgi:hypothetical protein